MTSGPDHYLLINPETKEIIASSHDRYFVEQFKALWKAHGRHFLIVKGTGYELDRSNPAKAKNGGCAKFPDAGTSFNVR